MRLSRSSFLHDPHPVGQPSARITRAPLKPFWVYRILIWIIPVIRRRLPIHFWQSEQTRLMERREGTWNTQQAR